MNHSHAELHFLAFLLPPWTAQAHFTGKGSQGRGYLGVAANSFWP